MTYEGYQTDPAHRTLAALLPDARAAFIAKHHRAPQIVFVHPADAATPLPLLAGETVEVYRALDAGHGLGLWMEAGGGPVR